MKCIVFKTQGNMPRLFPVMFPNNLTHADVAEVLLGKPGGEVPELKGATVDSAGEFTPLALSCSGDSVTLQVKSKPERDTTLVRMCDYSVDLTMGED